MLAKSLEQRPALVVTSPRPPSRPVLLLLEFTTLLPLMNLHLCLLTRLGALVVRIMP